MKGATNFIANPASSTSIMNKPTAEGKNIMHLKAFDPNIEEALFSASQVCLFSMSTEKQEWVKKNVEGQFFLAKMKTNPRFKIIILNNLNTENHSEVVDSSFEYEVNPPYLSYIHGPNEILGIWFKDKAEVEKVGKLLGKIKQGLPRPDVPPPAHLMAPASQASSQQDGFWDRQADVSKDTVPQPQTNLQHTISLPPQGNYRAQAPPVQAPAPTQQVKQAFASGTAASQVQAKKISFSSASDFFSQLSATQGADGAPVQLLPPSFFASTRTAEPQLPTPLKEFPQEVTEERPVNPLMKLLAKGAASGAPKPTPSPPAESPRALQSTPPPRPGQPGDRVQATRAKVRAAMSALLKKDAFVDMIAAELQAAGLIDG